MLPFFSVSSVLVAYLLLLQCLFFLCFFVVSVRLVVVRNSVLFGISRITIPLIPVENEVNPIGSLDHALTL